MKFIDLIPILANEFYTIFKKKDSDIWYIHYNGYIYREEEEATIERARFLDPFVGTSMNTAELTIIEKEVNSWKCYHSVSYFLKQFEFFTSFLANDWEVIDIFISTKSRECSCS